MNGKYNTAAGLTWHITSTHLDKTARHCRLCSRDCHHTSCCQQYTDRCRTGTCRCDDHTSPQLQRQRHTAQNFIELLQVGHPNRTRTHTFNSPFSGTNWVSRYQKGKANLDFTEARDSERQWHQLGRMQVCTSLQTDNHVST